MPLKTQPLNEAISRASKSLEGKAVNIVRYKPLPLGESDDILHKRYRNKKIIRCCCFLVAIVFLTFIMGFLISPPLAPPENDGLIVDADIIDLLFFVQIFAAWILLVQTNQFRQKVLQEVGYHHLSQTLFTRQHQHHSFKR